MRAQSLGSVGRPPLKALGASYRQAKAVGAPEIAQAQALGAAARRAGAASKPRAGQSSFGAKSRQVCRRRIRELRGAICSGLQSADKEQRAFSMGEWLAASGADTTTALSLARSALRLHEKRDKHARAEMETALKAFQEGAGAEMLKEFRAAVPPLNNQVLLPVPWPTGPMFEVFAPHRDLAAPAAAWAVESRESTLSTSLRQHWATRHKTLLEGDCRPVGEQQKGAAPTECRSVGRCVCSAEGQQIKRFKNSLLRCMKKVCPTGSEERAKLVQGFVVVHLIGRPAEGDDEAYLASESPVKGAWLHIGLQYLSPYRPTYMALQPVRDACGQEILDGTVLLQVQRVSCRSAPFPSICVYAESPAEKCRRSDSTSALAHASLSQSHSFGYLRKSTVVFRSVWRAGVPPTISRRPVASCASTLRSSSSGGRQSSQRLGFPLRTPTGPSARLCRTWCL